MAAAYYHMYHETGEDREIREAWNESNTGDRGVFEDPAARVELPTAAGSVMLDLGQMSGGGGSGLGVGGARATAKQRLSTEAKGNSRLSTLGSADRGNAKKTHGAAAKQKKGRRGSDDSMASADDDSSGGGGAPAGRRGPQVQFENGNGRLLFNKSDEDDVPPLTAEDAKARATRTAMLIEYAYRHEYAKMGGGGNDSKYDLVLSA